MLFEYLACCRKRLLRCPLDAGLVVLLHRYSLSWLIYSQQIGQNIHWLIELQYILKIMPYGQALRNKSYFILSAYVAISNETLYHAETRIL